MAGPNNVIILNTKEVILAADNFEALGNFNSTNNINIDFKTTLDVYGNLNDRISESIKVRKCVENASSFFASALNAYKDEIVKVDIMQGL